MKVKKVRANATYLFYPVMIDASLDIEPGTELTVRNLPGCPKANTMGHCHVVYAATGKFAGLVCCNSLKTRKEAEAYA